MNSNKVRDKFLDYFRAREHEIVPSAPLVVKDDPTLLFTNSGMNQFKDWFLGNTVPRYKRVADTQKCLRVSGKHNDLEEVGVDTYPHTMFEMLGNWSFGDYFKKEAIQWSWELLTAVYKIPADRLYVTVFEGSSEENLPPDEEASGEWKKWISPDRILNGNRKDNFWEMGDTGPCGPCSEIHIDLRDDNERKKTEGKKLVNTGHALVIEIWNNVFMEFNRKADGSLEKLPARHVDTGMGFERLCMVLQGKKSTYDTDVFQPIIQKIEDISGLRYRPNEQNKTAEVVNVGMRVVADHIRAISFAIADGQLPSNTGAGYVIRRILRRAVRYGYQSLGLKEPFLHRLVPVLSNLMGTAFPEIASQKLLVEKVIREEETAFFRTLEVGLKKIDQVCIEIVNASRKKKEVEGAVVFELYDTFGFPVDLTALIARGYGLSIDEKGFQVELEKQKTRSKQATKVDAGDWTELKPLSEVVFMGYEHTECKAELIRYRKITSKGKEMYQVVLNKTPFYAESGGQVGDTGILEFGNGKQVQVIDTKKENNLITHFIDKIPADHGGTVMAKVDAGRRLLTMYNHSATHLLHAALRKVLGTHVEQKGSLVNDAHLRFDFSHFSKVSEEELKKIESLVNEKIRASIPVEIRSMPLSEAKKIGAMALFGEKYGDVVRVVTMDKDYSIELCGGTHVSNTGQIGLFKIVSESAIAAGVRRIEAITSSKAEEHFAKQGDLLSQLRELMGNPSDLLKSITDLKNQNAELKRSLESYVSQKVNSLKTELPGKAKQMNGMNLIVERIDLDTPSAVKDLAFFLKDSIPNLLLILGTVSKGKPSITVAISDSLVKEKKLDAGKMVRDLAAGIKGGGGGQPFYATAGGSDLSGLDETLKKAISCIPDL